MELTQALHRASQQSPDLPATIFGTRVRTWAESRDRVARLAGALRAHGVGAGDRVAILALNSDRYHEYLFAVPWADARAHPGRTSAGARPRSRSRCEDAGTRILFVDDAFAPVLPAILRGGAGLRRRGATAATGAAPEGALAYEELIAGHEPVEDARRGGADPAGIFYTGGTTGTPKGVMLSHANLLVSALGSASSGGFMTPGGRLLHAAPMFHLADRRGVGGPQLGRRHPRDRPDVHPGGGGRGDREARGHRRPAGPDDDPDAHRRPRSRPSSTSPACGTSSTGPRRSREAVLERAAKRAARSSSSPRPTA